MFSAQVAKICKDAVEIVRRLAGSEHEVVVHDVHQPQIASRAAQRRPKRSRGDFDGKLADGCLGEGVEEHFLREALR